MFVIVALGIIGVRFSVTGIHIDGPDRNSDEEPADIGRYRVRHRSDALE